MIAHIPCRVAVFSVIVFLYYLLKKFVININSLYNMFVQCLNCLSVKGDLVLHVFLESMSVHNYKSIAVLLSQY